MGVPLVPHYADQLGAIVYDFEGNVLIAAGTTVPTGGTVGFAKGCLFFDVDAAIGSRVLVNQGSSTSCDFNLLAPVDLDTLTASAADLNTLDVQTLTTGAGAGITGGTGTIYKNSVHTSGGIITTRILIDLTGLASSTTDGDIIGVSTTPAHLGQILAAVNGTVLGGALTCLEVPVGGADDIDFYYATEATGKFDDAIGGLTSTALITKGSAWTLNQSIGIADPAAIADKYLYLCGGEAGTAATYTAGKFLLELWGY